MKKKLILILSFATLLLAWCNNSSDIEINPDTWTSSEWLSVQEVYNQEIESAQYIKDLENFLSYNILSLTEDEPFVSDMAINASFNPESSVQWGITFTENKYSKSRDLEDREIDFDIKAESTQDDLEPFYASWSLSLVYQNNEMYANIHKFWIDMWEENMLAKFYTLLWESLIGQRIDLEVHSGWFIVLNEKEDIKLQYIVWTFKNVLKSEWINEDSPNFLNGVAELIDTVNSHIDLWISTNALSLVEKETKYFQLSDWSIQRTFVWAFHWEDSEFTLGLISDKHWLKVRLYDIKKFDIETQSYVPTDVEIVFSIEENSKSNYTVKFISLKSGKVVVNIDWTLKYDNQVILQGDFALEPLDFIEQQKKVSWNINWKIIKKAPNGDEIFNEVSWETTSLSNILSSL